MGIREEEVEVDWDVCSQILKKSFLLTEIKQTQTFYKMCGIVNMNSFRFFSLSSVSFASEYVTRLYLYLRLLDIV